MKPAVFLDRDGVLVEALVRDNRAYAALKLSDFRLVTDARAQVKRLSEAGFECVVFTNQPEVARGHLDPETLDAMHQLLRQEVAVKYVYVCPHDVDDSCACRKPKPGLLIAAAHDLDLDLQHSYVIGDRWRDIDAGRAVGCFAILIERAYSACQTADARAAQLGDAVDVILTHAEERSRWIAAPRE